MTTTNAQPRARVIRMVFPDQTNHHGTMFGGDVLDLITAAASHATARVTPQPVVLAGTERIDFRAPIREGSIAEVDAWVTAIGHTSLTVDVVAHGEDLITGDRDHATTGRLVFVAVDVEGLPTPILESDPSDYEMPATWTTERVQPGQTNHNGLLIGGELMRLLDAVAFIGATRHVRAPLVTARVDALDLAHEVRVGDLLYIGASVVESGRRSLTMQTEAGIAASGSSGFTMVTSGRFVMVQVD